MSGSEPSGGTAGRLEEAARLEAEGALEAALAAYARELGGCTDPGECSRLWRAIGRLRQRRCEFTAAEVAMARAVALTPEDPLALCFWAAVLDGLSRHQEAGAVLERAVALDPACDKARLNLALHYLLHGRWAEAWPHYERRLAPGVAISLPDWIGRWDGQTSSPELLVVAEQGLGDLVQFSRYAPMLQLASPVVSLVADARLHGLLAEAGLFQRFHRIGEPFSPEPGAQWLPLMALPELVGLSPGQVLLDAPYLRAVPRQLEDWERRFGSSPGLRVGIGWQGNPSSELEGLAGRSLPLDILAPLAAVEGVELVALQKGPGSEPLDGCSFRERFSALQPEVDRTWDLLETLAILEQCDLVISTDTALAHLAAALGRPTWILLKAVPDWRWGLEGDTTPWYPCARLFRQRTLGDWPEVVERVAAALATLSTSRAKAEG